ncbi:MAG: glycosyltransferase [Pseudomonadota bacterium]
MLLLSFFMLVYHAGLFLWLFYGARKLSKVKNILPAEVIAAELPSLSIIVPARNEEKTLGVGLSSLIQLTYPRLEIFVVNDRSTDKTAQVIDEFVKRDQRLKAVTVDRLPERWLGKNHALQLGAFESQSELILFTDADVEMDDEFLKNAVLFFLKNQLDHCAGIPKVTGGTPVLYPLLGVFGLAFSLFTRPWQGKDPNKKQAVGIGAFNLVRRAAYLGIGGHSQLSLRPDDDLKLALLFKRSGFKTDCVNAVEGLRVEWYSNAIQLMRGLEKNTMTGFEYSFPKAILGNILFTFTFLFPFFLPLLNEGPSSVFSWAALLCLFLSYAGQLYEARMPLWCVPFFPFAALGILFIVVRACWLTFRNQGVYWRDTFYSLDVLRSNRF